MVLKCAICPNKYGPLAQISFHRFPLSAEKCKQWAVLCRRNDLIDVDPKDCNRLYRLCSPHFDESQFVGSRLIPDAIPSKFEWNALLNEPKEIAYQSICPDLIHHQPAECSPNDWSQIQSNSTPKSNSVARSLLGSFSSNTSTVSSTDSSCQTTQTLSSHTPRKDKLQKLLGHKKDKYNELQQKFNILKKNHANNQKTFSSLEHFQLMCDKFLSRGLSNFVKVQSKLTLQNPKGHRQNNLHS